jgi:hypothetical protein
MTSGHTIGHGSRCQLNALQRTMRLHCIAYEIRKHMTFQQLILNSGYHWPSPSGGMPVWWDTAQHCTHWQGPRSESPLEQLPAIRSNAHSHQLAEPCNRAADKAGHVLTCPSSSLHALSRSDHEHRFSTANNAERLVARHRTAQWHMRSAQDAVLLCTYLPLLPCPAPPTCHGGSQSCHLAACTLSQ